MNSKVEKRLADAGIILPEINSPAANYVSFLQTGSFVYVSGQTCKWNGELQYKGAVGKDISIEKGIEAARLSGLNLLLQLKLACNGDLDRVRRCVKLTAFICADDTFIQHSVIANGASDVMLLAFAEQGKHARSAVGAVSLPGLASVEVEGIFELHQ